MPSNILKDFGCGYFEEVFISRQEQQISIQEFPNLSCGIKLSRSHVTEKEIEASLQSVLKHAKDRSDGRSHQRSPAAE